jgi:hypothetical protein
MQKLFETEQCAWLRPGIVAIAPERGFRLFLLSSLFVEFRSKRLHGRLTGKA